MREVHELLKQFVERLHGAAASNLESVILYGSAADGDFHAHSDVNVLCILRSLAIEELAKVSEPVRWWTTIEKQPAPLFFTAAELRASADVFAIELLDMQRTHRVLYGSDPVGSLNVPLNLHRIQVEHELRTLLLKLRQHFVLTSGDASQLAASLARASSSIVTLLRHALLALGEQPSSQRLEVFTRISTLTGADHVTFEAVLSLREGSQNTAVVSTYSACMRDLEKIIAVLDKHVPKHQWKRASSSSS